MTHPLADLNGTELIEVCRQAGTGNVSRAAPRDALYAAADGDERLAPDALENKRVTMQQHIATNWRRLRTQLPGCTGKCTTHGCPDIIVQRCWKGFEGDIL